MPTAKAYKNEIHKERGAVSGRHYTDGEYILHLKGIQRDIAVGWPMYWGELAYEIALGFFAIYFIVRHVFDLNKSS